MKKVIVNQHSLISPSKLGLTIKCPYTLSIPNDNKPSAMAELGTKYHKIMEDYIQGTISELPDIPALHTAAIKPLLLSELPDAEVNTEMRVFFGDFFNVDDTLAFGTADLVIYTPTIKTLHILDYKFGRVPVNVKGNVQLAMYAYGALREYPNAKTVSMHIIQPMVQSDTADIWTLSKSDLLDFINEKIPQEIRVQFSKYVLTGIAEVLDMNVGNHCSSKYCKHRSNCAAYQKTLTDILQLNS